MGLWTATRLRFDFAPPHNERLEFGRQFVRQRLPDAVKFVVYPNQSYDGRPRVGDEVVFPDESLPDGQYHGPWSTEEDLGFCWRDGKVPEWINIAVEAEDRNHSIVALKCCGRFTAQEDLLYYRLPGELPPFGIKGPTIPPAWTDAETSGKFDLYWSKRRRRRMWRLIQRAVGRSVDWFRTGS